MWYLTLLLLVLPFSVTNAQYQTIGRIGNDIIASSRGSDWQGTTFLLNTDPFYSPEGILFAFAAYFRNDNPMKFQVWRLVNMANKEYKLVKEWEISPTVSDAREDVYLAQRQEECVYLKKDDRIGIYTSVTPGSVAFTFNSSTPQALQYITDPNNPPHINSTVTFDPLAYPYKFSAAAYIDTDLSKYPDPEAPSCPKAMLIPADTAFPRNVPGATGATGPEGKPGKAGATGATGPQGIEGIPGEDGKDGAQGIQGPQGEKGDKGYKGEKGEEGDKGEKGDKGEHGIIGATGPSGPAGPIGPKEVSQIDDEVGDCTWCWKLLNPYLILALIIWLLVITIIMLIAACVACCRRRNPEARHTSYSSSTMNGWNHKDLWKSSYDDVEVETGSKPGYDNPSMDNSYYVPEGRTAF